MKSSRSGHMKIRYEAKDWRVCPTQREDAGEGARAPSIEVVTLQHMKVRYEATDWKVCPAQREDAGEGARDPSMKSSRSA
jgi:membrane protein implicated in regulation of membrane protease activity